jgi:hypothetical protein
MTVEGFLPGALSCICSSPIEQASCESTRLSGLREISGLTRANQKDPYTMPLNCGIVGLPNVGKSTIFNALTAAKAQAANYPFCTIDPNTGIVSVPDERLDRITRFVKPNRTVPTTMEFIDIAGLVEGASKGEGLGNQFLGHNKELLAGPMRLAISSDAPKQCPAWNMDFDQEQAAPRA